MIELRRTPQSTLRGFLMLLGSLITCSALAYFYQGYVQHLWWNDEYIVSLAIPFTLIAMVVWFGFVPGRMRYDDQGIELTSHLGRAKSLPFAQMKHWGLVDGLILLEFDHLVQISRSFYLPSECEKFQAFLEHNFPERRTALWLGTRGVGMPGQ